MVGKHWLKGTLNLYGLKLSFQVDKVNILVKRSIVNIVKRMFSFHSWEGCDFCPCLGYVTIFIPNSPPPTWGPFCVFCLRDGNATTFCRFDNPSFFCKISIFANMCIRKFISNHKILQKFEKSADLSFRNFADLRRRIFADLTSTIPHFLRKLEFCKYVLS